VVDIRIYSKTRKTPRLRCQRDIELNLPQRPPSCGPAVLVHVAAPAYPSNYNRESLVADVIGSTDWREPSVCRRPAPQQRTAAKGASRARQGRRRWRVKSTRFHTDTQTAVSRTAGERVRTSGPGPAVWGRCRTCRLKRSKVTEPPVRASQTPSIRHVIAMQASSELSLGKIESGLQGSPGGGAGGGGNGRGSN